MRLPVLAGAVCLLGLWLGGMAWWTDRGVRRVEDFSTIQPADPSIQEPWRTHRFFIDPDSYQWLAMARDLRAATGLRVRWTLADNAPYGREVYWSNLPVWLLAGLSWGLERVAGLAPPLALELAGRALMPLAGFVFTAGVFLALARRGRGLFAALAAASLAVYTQYNFHTLRPDHHGFQIAFLIGTVVCLLGGQLGWSQAPAGSGNGEWPAYRRARRSFILAGVFSGLALWVGATVFEFFLLALGAGMMWAIVSLPAGPARAQGAELRPELFRWWGATGALTALVFYLIEYAPGHCAMRLEANHPLHALCLLGVSECLRALARWKQNPQTFGRRDGLAAGLGLAAAAVLPALVLRGPAGWYLPRTALLLRLHDRFIVEFRSLLESGSLSRHFDQLPLLAAGCGAGLVGLILWRCRRLKPGHQIPQQVLGGSALILFLLTCWQVRWEQLLIPVLALWVAYAWLALVEGLRGTAWPRTGGLICVAAALLAWLPVVTAATGQVQTLIRLNRVERMNDIWIRMMLQRNIMMQLKTAQPAGGAAWRWMLPLEMAPAAYYFGIGTGVGSLYWENLDGLRATAEFFGDRLPGARTYEIARARGITHILLDQERGEGDAYAYYNLLTGQADYTNVTETVGYTLATEENLDSDWLHPEPALSEAAARPTYVWLPGEMGWTSFRMPVRIYRVQVPAPQTR